MRTMEMSQCEQVNAKYKCVWSPNYSRAVRRVKDIVLCYTLKFTYYRWIYFRFRKYSSTRPIAHFSDDNRGNVKNVHTQSFNMALSIFPLSFLIGVTALTNLNLSVYDIKKYLSTALKCRQLLWLSMNFLCLI